MVSRKGFIPVVLIAVLALVIAAGGVGIGLAWKTEYLDKWLPPNIKELFGRGEKPEEEPTEEPEEDPTENWKTYTNTKYNYQLKVPENFEVQAPATIEHPRLSLGWMDSSDDDHIGFGEEGSEEPLYIDVHHFPDAPFFNPPLGTELIGWLKENFEGTSFPDKPNFEIDGIPTVKRTNPPEWGEGGAVGDVIYFIKNDRLFSIEIVVGPDESISENFREISYLILSTFKFLE